MGIPIALPRVGAGRQDAHPRFPNPPGGANGTIALPSRIATAEGTGTPARPDQTPGRDGARGAIRRIFAYTDNPWNWANPASRRNATPQGYSRARYIRQAVPNVAGIRTFAVTDATTVGTTNRPGASDGGPASPIPFSRKQVVQTFAPIFDSRSNTLYAPRAIIQRPQAARKVMAGPSIGRAMAQPWQFNLSRLAPTTTYGQQTSLIGQPAAPAPAPVIPDVRPAPVSDAHGRQAAGIGPAVARLLRGGN